MKGFTEEIFKTAIYEKYNDAFDLSNINFNGIHTPIRIKCNKCGYEYDILPSTLLYSNSKCSNCLKIEKKEKLLNEFKKRINDIYGEDYFDFTYADYVNDKTPIKLKCNKCGKITELTPQGFYKGTGCENCNPRSNRVKSLEEVIQDFKNEWGDRYDYSEIKEYHNSHEKLPIICHEKDEEGNEHGIFYLSYQKHFKRKQGCSKCNGGVKKPLEYYIKKAQQYHKDENGEPLYDYSQITEELLKNNKVKIPIRCKKHGIFWMSMDNHIRGKQGCPFCNMSKLEQEIMNFLNDNNIKFIFQANKSTLEWLDKLTLDFYLPDYNAAIECQGEQHFGRTKNTSSIFTDEKINQVKKRDKLKRQLCEDNEIKLLYYSNLKIEYPYHVFEDKNELLTEIIKK